MRGSANLHHVRFKVIWRSSVKKCVRKISKNSYLCDWGHWVWIQGQLVLITPNSGSSEGQIWGILLEKSGKIHTYFFMVTKFDTEISYRWLWEVQGHLKVECRKMRQKNLEKWLLMCLRSLSSNPRLFSLYHAKFKVIWRSTIEKTKKISW